MPLRAWEFKSPSPRHFLLQVYASAKSGYKKHRLPVWVSVNSREKEPVFFSQNPPERRALWPAYELYKKTNLHQNSGLLKCLLG